MLREPARRLVGDLVNTYVSALFVLWVLAVTVALIVTLLGGFGLIQTPWASVAFTFVALATAVVLVFLRYDTIHLHVHPPAPDGEVRQRIEDDDSEGTVMHVSRRSRRN